MEARVVPVVEHDDQWTIEGRGLPITDFDTKTGVTNPPNMDIRFMHFLEPLFTDGGSWFGW